MTNGRLSTWSWSRPMAIGLLTFATPALVWAGCPNPCELVVEPLTVEPPFDCATLSKAFEEGCSCGVRFDIDNTRACTTPVRAVGFEFDSCLPSAPDGPCNELQPTEQGSVVFSLVSLGETRRSFVFEDGAGEHRVNVVARVKSFGAQGCDVAAPRREPDHNGWTWPFVLFVAACTRLVFRSPARRRFRWLGA